MKIQQSEFYCYGLATKCRKSYKEAESAVSFQNLILVTPQRIKFLDMSFVGSKLINFSKCVNFQGVENTNNFLDQ
jgi:hypothetical protein